MVEKWMEEVKRSANPGELGMMLVHNGVVRASSKDGKAVKGMHLSYDRGLLAAAVDEARGHEGIADVRVWINEGDLKVGDDIMYVLVAGRFRTDVLPVLQELLSKVKGEVVREDEVSS
ncbi:MAG: molybdenum cofactor biosynthesis protein MoaE [Syntrophorhabdaceae bacterium]|nr:molybdenum cofactor biosynthesis protein MoaE [Syntrophorhabdaceae bacterium]